MNALNEEVKEILRAIEVNNQERLRLYEEWKQLHNQLLELLGERVAEVANG